MNELVFTFHILVMISFVLIALRLGKNILMSLIALLGVFANLFVVKQISLFGFSVTASDVFAIGDILALNLLQEYFGKEAAKKSIRANLVALLFFAVCSQIHLLYQPNAWDRTDPAFQTIFSHSPRIVFASIASFYLIQLFDVRFFSFLKGSLPVRIAISLFCSQFLDTLFFSVLGLWGIAAELFDIILVSFLIKGIVILASVPFAALSKRWVRSEI